MNLPQQRRYASAFLRWYARQEARTYRLVLNWLAMVQTEVLAALNQYGIEKTIEAIADHVPESPILQLLTRIYQYSVFDAAKRELTRLRIISGTGTVESVTAEAGFFSHRWQTTIGNMLRDKQTAARITSISETTRTQIRQVLVQANIDQLDVRTTAKRIRVLLSGKDAASRALMIARTETTRATSAGNELGAMSSSLLLNKVWIATLDSRTRPTHAAMIGKKPVPRDGYFIVGGQLMRYPGDPAGGPAETVGCRCTQVYVPAATKTND